MLQKVYPTHYYHLRYMSVRSSMSEYPFKSETHNMIGYLCLKN